MSPVRSAALLAFVLGRCCMKAISSSRVDSFGHHHLELGAGGSGKQTGSAGSGKHTRFFSPSAEKNSYHTLASQGQAGSLISNGAVAQEIGQRRNKKGGGTKKELGRPRASEAASSFVGFLNPWVKEEKAKQQQHQGSPTPRGRRKPRPAATWWRLVHRHASVRTPQEEDGGEPGQQDARIFLVSDSRAVFHRLYGTKENVRCGHTSERNVVVVRLGQGA